MKDSNNKNIIKRDVTNVELLAELVNKEAIKPLKRYNKKYLKKLLECNEQINIETINLLQQANYTIQNVYKLLERKEIVDSATLMRSSMEKIMMSMMIYFDVSNTYEEFKDLKKCGKGEFTRPSKVLENFKLKLNVINPFLFEEFSENELKLLLGETYEKLCLYTHSSIAVSMMIEVKNNNDEDLFIAFFYLINYFLELLLYCCLKYLNNDDEEHIDLLCLLIAWGIPFTKIDKNKLNEEYIGKYKNFLYWDKNSKFNDKYKDITDKIMLDIVDLKKEINNNSNILNNYILNLLKNK